MILYQAPKGRFLTDLEESRVDQILADGFQRSLGHAVAPSELASWRSSLQYVGNVLRDPQLPQDLGVSVECQIPSTSKRIDVVLTGTGLLDSEHAVIIELKQWQRARRTEKDGIVSTFLGGAERDVVHPSHQAHSYALLLTHFNEVIHTDEIQLHPCAFLHNCDDAGELRDPFYQEYLSLAPLFIRQEVAHLRGFIREFIRQGDRRDIRGRIERSRLRPSRQLSEVIGNLLDQQPEFVLVDEQKEVFETGLFLARQAAAKSTKEVLIVEGGPGTGKSVVAINLMARLIAQGRFAQYVSKNRAPREVYGQKLAGRRKKFEIVGLFRGSGGYTESPVDSCDCLVIDEAHRLNLKSGLYSNLGENQIKELISAARCSIFFIDEDQRVTMKDIGSKEAIREQARHFGARITERRLESQFRCHGSDAYLAWLDHVLGIRVTANTDIKDLDYEFRVVDCPRQLHDEIRRRNGDNKARVVAGYCWDWASKKDKKAFDIVIDEGDYRAQWNLSDDGSLWIVNPDSVEQVGCIHTCQGLEVEHIGVIIGPDLRVENGRLVTDPSARARADKSIHGWKQGMKADPVGTQAQTEAIIRNTYRTLMTRGMKSCHIYATDPAVRLWFRQHGAQ